MQRGELLHERFGLAAADERVDAPGLRVVHYLDPLRRLGQLRALEGELEDVCDHVGIMNKGKVLLERSLSELQENTVKMQIVFRGEGAPELPTGLNLLHESHLGRVFTIIFRGNTQQITERLAALDPVYMEAVPLTLEEIFIYELGGADYAVRDIVL